MNPITDKELTEHYQLCEAEYKAALMTEANWEEKQRDDCEKPIWLGNMVERTRLDFLISYELAFRRGILDTQI